MIYLKSEDEIELLRESNLLVSATHAQIAPLIKVGVKTSELDKIAEEFIRDNDGIPGFLNYNGFPNTLCTSVNEEVVHGIPSDYELKDGDIISVDCGVLKNGYYGDSAYTYLVGEVDLKIQKLLEVTKESLMKAIEVAIDGNRLGDIGFAVQNYVQSFGYSVVRELTGHGVGKNLHEEPIVKNYGKRGRGSKLRNGMVIAIEPMVNMGTMKVRQENDGWTIRTLDKLPSAHFEHTIAIRNGKADILSNFDIIEDVLKKKK